MGSNRGVKIILATLVLTAVLAPCCLATGKHWVLITAGSKTYDNYRHQANACHAYQIFVKNGVPKEQIILMMYNDVAHNHQNPYKGTLINKPNGPDVYKGCQVDYSHFEVTPTHFLHVLKGEKLALQKLTGRLDVKVIDSGPEDHIFVTFTDHGAKGLIGFPNIADLHRDDFQKAIEWMYENKRYAEMILYIEACESGSMFHHFRDDLNVFAVSSTNKSELGYACYFDEKRNVFLSDFFSAGWMEDSDRGQLDTETFFQQFKVAYNRSTTGKDVSHPQMFGNLTFANATLAQFQAGVNKTISAFDLTPPGDFRDAVRADLVVIETLSRRLRKLPESSNEWMAVKKRLDQETRMYQAGQAFVKHVAERALRDHDDTNVQKILSREDSSYYSPSCYKAAIAASKVYCPGQVNDRFYYVFSNYYVLAKLCNVVSLETVVDAVASTAKHTPLCRV